ncbi:aquaporin-like protein, partial [Delphinella strobiligena]
PTINIEGSQGPGIRRRNTSRRSDGDSQLRPTRTGASRRSNFTLGGPEDTSALRAQHAPFVHPGYADLNPAYEQPANTKPVWSLAKPLPRVVRPGMVPTMSEVNVIRNQLPGENAASQGIYVDPEDLEKGKIQKTIDPSKLSAQLKDARAQREHNFLQRHTGNTRTSRRSRLGTISQTDSRASTRRPRRRRSTWRQGDVIKSKDNYERPSTADHLPPIQEGSRERPYQPDTAFDDAASLTTLGNDDELPDKELEPIVENIIEEEVHNHHTSWSVIRTHNREFLGEVLGVIIQLSVGFCTDLAVTVADAGNPNTTPFGWGFATMSAIYVCGGISGAHLNPAVTIMLYIYRGFPKRMMPQYFIAQFLGAFIAAFIAYGIYYASIKTYLQTNDTSGIIGAFVTNQRYTDIDPATAFFNEFYGSVVLAVIILALGDDSNAPPGAGMNALIIGFVVCMNSIAFQYQTGAALNPSRDFGPRLALLALGYGSSLFTNPYWFYGPFCAAILGVCVGGGLYDAAIFTGGESPINYPWTRTRRSMHKFKKRWYYRFGLAK